MTSSAGSTSRGTTSCLAASSCRTGLQSRWRPPSQQPPLEAERRRVMASGTVVVVGGTRGLGREVAQFYAGQGKDVVVTGRDAATAVVCASEIGGSTSGVGLDLAEPHDIAGALAGVRNVEYLVLAAIERDMNTVREYDIEAAMRLVTLKVVG